MTAAGLIEALADEISDAVRMYRLKGDRDPPKEVTIYRQYIPVERFEDKDGRYHPLILVALRTIEDDKETEYEVGLTFGVYGESDETWIDLLNLMETVRLRLLSRRLINRRYRLVGELVSEISEIQPAPFFYGEMVGRYMSYQPQEERGKSNGSV